MLVHADNQPHAGRRFEATVVWMNARPLEPNRPYLLKHSTQTAQARIREIRYRVDINSLAHQPAGQLQLNEIAVISVETQRPLFFDPYRKNRATGSFILIDPISNETLGAGMIEQAVSASAPKGRVTASERAATRGHAAFAVCLQPGQQDLAYALERLLFDHGCVVQVLEKPQNLGQAIRTSYGGGLIAILVPSEIADRQAVQESLPPGRVVLPDPASPASVTEAARRILNHLDGLGLMSASQGPLTDGAGI
jgi:hypothetical protein